MDSDILAGIKARLQEAQERRSAAERDIRDANDRYASADREIKALELLLPLFEAYAKNDPMPECNYHV